MFCPTHLMLADYYTKPLVGSGFRDLRSVIMGYKSIDEVNPSFLHKIKERIGIQIESLLDTKNEDEIFLLKRSMINGLEGKG